MSGGRFLALVLALVSAVTFFAPPLLYPPMSISNFIQDFFKFRSPIYNEIPLISYILVSFILYFLIYSIVFFARYFINQFARISVLETALTLAFTNKDLSVAIVEREQYFHANRKNISAYHFQHSVTAKHGTIDLSNILLISKIGDRTINTTENGEISYIISGSEKTVDLIETYERNLPRSILATLLPNSFVLFLHKNFHFFSRSIVYRTGRMCYLNEFNTDQPRFEISAYRYPVTNVKLKVVFPEHTDPGNHNVKGMIIDDNSVKRVQPSLKTENSNTIYEIKVRKFANKRLRITWKNELLSS